MTKKKNNFMGPVFLLITAFCWGTTMVAQKLGSEYVGPFTYNAYRFLISGVILLTIYCIKMKIKHIRYTDDEIQEMQVEQGLKPRKKIWIVGLCLLVSLSLFVGSTLQQFGIEDTSPGQAGFLASLYILFVPVLGLLFKKKTNLVTWLTLLVALVGSFLISYEGDFNFSFGNILIIICAIGFAFQIIFIDIVNPYIDTLHLSGIQFMFVGIFSFIFKIIFEGFDVEGFKNGFLAILYASIFSGCIAYTFQIFGQKSTPTALASLIMSLESVFSLLSSLIVMKEVLEIKQWIGCGLVFAAIIAQIYSIKSKEKIIKENCEIVKDSN